MIRGMFINGNYLRAACVALAMIFISAPAFAQTPTVIIQNPTTYSMNQPFQMRTSTRAHRGNDYLVPCGTTLQTVNPVECRYTDPGGYGRVGYVNYTCDVQTRYAHLSSCSNGNTSVVSGGAEGSDGAGNSEGCHLHYEIRIDGVAVDPMKAYGQNLCDPAVRESLIDDANDVLNGQAGGGGGAGQGPVTTTPPPAPPTSGTAPTPDTEVGFEYVPGGTATNPGRGYTIVETADGRTHTVVDLEGEDFDRPILGPTTENVVQYGETSNPVTGCATDTWAAMVNQSVLQTRREMLYNQRFIAKPDSVLAYSCFAESAMRVEQRLGPVFSESQRWVNTDIDLWDRNNPNDPLRGETSPVDIELGEYSLDGAIVSAAMEPYEAYLDTNFRHGFLGELMEAPGAGVTGEGNSQAYAPCGMMSQVWQQAKCMNLSDEPLFRRFEELISFDPREYPRGFACNNSGITQNMIDIADGSNIVPTVFETHLDLLYTDSMRCAPPIYTGVTVNRRFSASRLTFERTNVDALCVTAGCSYVDGQCRVVQP